MTTTKKIASIPSCYTHQESPITFDGSSAWDLKTQFNKFDQKIYKSSKM